MKTICEVLMDRDGYSKEEAEELIEDAWDDLIDRLENGEVPENICQEWFGL